jgi:aryl-phospho-beta-D-glucosidase BglC (GH1 family)
MDKLSVRGSQIVDQQGRAVYLRGTCIGGWMNMENFIDGYPGSEHGLRATLAEVLGPGPAQFFCERLLDHFLTESDLAFIRQLGANVVRLPLNYRQFEADAHPFQYLEAGLERLDRALAWCEAHGLYAILDLHAVQGWQNTDWHSDNANRNALFWLHPHFQDRFVALWTELARRYHSRAVVAGYNVMNEPVTNAPRGLFNNQAYHTDWAVLNAVYRRVVEAIQAVDPDHLIFLEGDFFSNNFSGLDAPFAPNLIYGSHNYTEAGFGPGPYPGQFGSAWWDKDKQAGHLRNSEGWQFTQAHGAPLWAGEFGSVYNGPAEEIPDRLRAMDDQLAVFNEAGLHWTTWTYKDAGVMGWVTLNPEGEYLQRLRHVLDAKRELDTDFWLMWSGRTPAKDMVNGLTRLVLDTIPDEDLDYEDNQTYLRQASLANYVGELMQPAYAKCFRGLSESRLDEILQSFRLENCVVRHDLAAILRRRLPLDPLAQS